MRQVIPSHLGKRLLRQTSKDPRRRYRGRDLFFRVPQVCRGQAKRTESGWFRFSLSKKIALSLSAIQLGSEAQCVIGLRICCGFKTQSLLRSHALKPRHGWQTPHRLHPCFDCPARALRAWACGTRAYFLRIIELQVRQLRSDLNQHRDLARRCQRRERVPQRVGQLGK